nr:hypothetical protein [Clostridium neonatale]
MNNQLENRISSREVAEMMETRHDTLLAKIDKINLVLTPIKLWWLNIG